MPRKCKELYFKFGERCRVDHKTSLLLAICIIQLYIKI